MCVCVCSVAAAAAAAGAARRRRRGGGGGAPRDFKLSATHKCVRIDVFSLGKSVELQMRCALLLLMVAAAQRPPGSISLFAGGANDTGAHARSLSLMPGFDNRVLSDNAGGFYVIGATQPCIRYISPGGISRLVVGSCNSNAPFTCVSSGPNGDGGAATSALACQPRAMALNGSGLFFADAAAARVRFVSFATGEVRTVVGNATACTGGVALAPAAGTSVCLGAPSALALSPDGGALYIGDAGGRFIAAFSPATGLVRLVAGAPGGAAPTPAASGDGGAALLAAVQPLALAVNATSGDVFFADGALFTVRVLRAGAVLRVAGVPGSSPATPAPGGLPLETPLSAPCGLAFNGSAGAPGVLLISECAMGGSGKGRLRAFRDNATALATLAGFGGEGYASPTTALLAGVTNPTSISYDNRTGAVLFADNKAGNARVRQLLPNGTVVTVAGPGSWAGLFVGAPATALQYGALGVVDVKADPLTGSVAVVDSVGSLFTNVGSGGNVQAPFLGRDDRSWAFGPDGAPGPSFAIPPPTAVAADGLGGFFVAVAGVASISGIVRLAAGGAAVRLLGGPNAATCGGNGVPLPSPLATLSVSYGMVFNASANALLFSEGAVVRRLAFFANGTPSAVTHFAGVCGVSASSADGGAAAGSSLAAPYGLALDPAGSLLIAEFNGHRVRHVSAATGVLTTLAGTGAPGYAGNGGPALAALLRNPAGVAVDPVCGTVFVSESWNGVVRKFPVGGVITLAAGRNANGFDGDGGPAAAAALASPRGIDIDMRGRLFIADSTFARVRAVEPGGTGPCAPPPTFTASAAPTASAATPSPSLSAAPSATATRSAAHPACPPGSAPAALRVFTPATSPAAFYAPPGTAAVYVSLWGGGGAGGNATGGAFGGGGAFVGGWLGGAGLAALAAGAPLLVVAGGGGAYWPAAWAPPPVGGAAFRGASGYPHCGGTGAGGSAVGLPGEAPLAVAGAGGGAGETSAGRGATWDGSVPAPPCTLWGASGAAFAGQSGSLVAGGAPGCGLIIANGNGTVGGGPMVLPTNLATGGAGALCGGVGGGGMYGGGGGAWWNGGGGGSSFVGGLTGAQGQSAAGRTPGGAAAPGYAAGVGFGALPRGRGGDGLATLLPCVVLATANESMTTISSFPCGGGAVPSATIFTHTGEAQSYMAPPNTTALYAALWGAGGSPGKCALPPPPPPSPQALRSHRVSLQHSSPPPPTHPPTHQPTPPRLNVRSFGRGRRRLRWRLCGRAIPAALGHHLLCARGLGRRVFFQLELRHAGRLRRVAKSRLGHVWLHGLKRRRRGGGRGGRLCNCVASNKQREPAGRIPAPRRRGRGRQRWRAICGRRGNRRWHAELCAPQGRRHVHGRQRLRRGHRHRNCGRRRGLRRVLRRAGRERHAAALPLGACARRAALWLRRRRWRRRIWWWCRRLVDGRRRGLVKRARAFGRLAAVAR